MEWDPSFTMAFHRETVKLSTASPIKGFWLVVAAQLPRFYIKIIWELFTTFVIYSPGTNILRTVLFCVNRKWPFWNVVQRDNVIAFLRKLDRWGEVSKELEM